MATDAALKRFSEYYQQIYGERWPALLAALQEPVSHVAVVNQFVDPQDTAALLQHFSRHQSLPFCYVSSEGAFPQPPIVRGISAYYLMDAASLLPPLALGVQADHTVLDVCAAPGGKSLVLAYCMGDQGTGRLSVNEPQPARRQRLDRVMKEYLPQTMLNHVVVRAYDAAKHIVGLYDRILVDAPCSTERHLLRDAAELKTWTPERSKLAAARQVAILLSAARALRPGGRVVYATCSISPLENDGVVAAVRSKIPALCSVAPAEIFILRESFGETTPGGGWMVLPDRTTYGPLYVHVLERPAVQPRAQSDSESDSDSEASEVTPADAAHA